jgi:glycosyltransferase involved in cell wall biosynthesis
MAGEEYLASIVVPVLGRAGRTLAFVQEVTATTPSGAFELVMVDMGSTDATADVLAALSGDVQTARLVDSPGRGGPSFAAAANLGAKMARGRHLIFLSPACSPRSGWFERLVAVLASYAQVGAVGPAIVVSGRQAPWVGLALSKRRDGALGAFARYQAPGAAPQVPVTAVPSIALAARREAFEALGGFDEAYQGELGDLDLCLRLTEAGWTVLCDVTASVSLAGPVPFPGLTPADVSTLTERWSGKAVPDAVTEQTGRLRAVNSPPTEPFTHKDWGANVVGYFEAELGIGQSARLVVDAVEAAGGRTATYSYYRHHNRAEHHFRHRRVAEGRFPFPFNVVCLNGDMLPYWAAENAEVLSGRYTAAMWHWELEELPANFVAALDGLDEVWAGSEFTRRAIAAATDKPVVTLPLPVPARSGRPPHSRAEAGLPEGFVFGFMCDANSTLARKNPDGLVSAFCQAFGPGEGPLLALKVTNGQRAGLADKLRALAGERPDVVILDNYLPPELNASWTGLVDCYVSLHRSEGFGLTIAEAMAWGTPVIATGYSGNLDFTKPDNAFLVPWAYGTVPPGNLYPPGGRWAEPDLDEAAWLLRYVWEHPDEARARGKRGQADLARSHSPQAAAAVVARRAEAIGRMLQSTPEPPRNEPPLKWQAGQIPLQRYRPVTARLNLGAGDDRREGYFSVDLRPDVADVLADVTRLPFADGSMSDLVASDLLEHFPADRTAAVLAEWHRVLAPGGKLTVRVPNLLALAQILVRGGPEPAPEVVRNIYGGHRWGPDGAWDAHHTGWTPEMLHEELRRAGFLVMSDDGEANNTVTAMKLGG